MNIRSFALTLTLVAFSLPAFATKAVNDDFTTNGTADTDAAYFGSSASNAIKIADNSIGLVSGSSGRQIHALFETQNLENAGDSLRVMLTFTTPATVAATNEDLRIGLFDHLERIGLDQLGQNTSYSSNTDNGNPGPNALFNDLPGFYLELDVESSDPASDLDFRRSDPSTTGRFISTSSGYTSFGSGPDVGYAIEANTQYTLVLTITRSANDTLVLRADFGDATYSVSDLVPASFKFGMLGLGASSGAFGSSNSASETDNGDEDNGIEINSFSVELIPGDPSDGGGSGEGVLSTVVDDAFADGSGTREASNDAAYFGSSTPGAIEFNGTSIGLVSGSSSRQIHALFETQTLATAGDSLSASITFTTPASVGTISEDLRIGLFDHLERTAVDQLAQDTSYSSNTDNGNAGPNALYEGLPGFYLELDVDSMQPTTDLDIRRSDPSTTGRLISTTSGFTSLGNSPDVGYEFSANTEYTVEITVTRTATNTLDIRADFADATFVASDLAPASFNIGMLAMGASSGAFGTSNSANEADNGIEINSFKVDVTTFEPTDGGGGDGEEGSEGGSDVSLVVVDDDFLNDGSTETDASYFASNSESAIEFNADSLGLVSGTSGRHIHGLFDTQALERVGDILRMQISFTTPDTVSIGGDDIRLGMFDHLGRDSDTELGQNTTFSSSSPNPLFASLPGYYVEIDVERFSPQSDLEIGRSNPTTTGRFLNTNGGFTRTNGPDVGYTIQPNSDYTVYLEAERTETGLDVTANFLGRTLTVIDDAPLSFNFNMLGINASSDAFGVANTPGVENNGIDISKIRVEFIRSSVADDNYADDGTAETDVDFFASSTSSAIEINNNSIGLVSGSSGRQIHGLFDTQNLAKAGDMLEASITFVTPATVAITGEDLRIGIFDHLGRNGEDRLGQGTSFSSGTPNPDYAGLPGYYVELDIEASDATTDLEIYRSDPSATGRLLTTSSGFSALDDSMDIGYVIEADTEYTLDLTLLRTEAGELDVTAAFLGTLFKVTDAAPESFDFGMLALYANSNAVGSSNSPGSDPAVANDNGIDITNVSINFSSFFEPPLIDLPPVELPEGDHPDVEIIPTVPGSSGSGDGSESDDFSDDLESGDTSSSLTNGNPIAAVMAIVSTLILDNETSISGAAAQVAAFFDLDPNAAPWENFDLSDWALDAPNPDPEDGLSARTDDAAFANGQLFPGSEPFFFTGSDGAMVFKSIVSGARTSQNTSYGRSELREMLRAGDTSISTRGVNGNNWALDHQPENPDIAARGGTLTATLSIDQVTSSGSSGQVGRVIIGQIHAEDDEPLRLYYRKLPNNTKGSIYAVHEIRGGDDINVDIIGSRSNSAPDPVDDGISLGELFSYEVINIGADIEIIIRRGDKDGEIIGQHTFEMDTIVPGGSGYDVVDEWMYFKAGAYSQNNTGWANDFDQVRFYRLENSHE